MNRPLFSAIGSAIALCLMVLSGTASIAQTNEPSEAQPANESTQNQSPLIIGVSHTPPFAIETKTANGSDWDGIGVHLWREIAEDLDIDYEWQQILPNEAAQQVQNGAVDIAITASATAEGEQQLDFTQSYYTSSLGIAQPRRRRLIDVVLAVLSPRFLWICLWLSLLFVLVGTVVWLFERNKEDNTYGSQPRKGLWNSFWWAGVTLTTIGYGDIAPISAGGRIVAMLWMLLSMGITASLTASITAVVSQDSSGQLTQFANLRAMTVGSIEGSSAAEALQQQDISFQSVATPLQGLDSVEAGEIDVFIYDAALLRYINKNSLQNRLAIESTNLQAQRYAFAMPENADSFEEINAQLMREHGAPDWQSLLERFLPRQSR